MRLRFWGALYFQRTIVLIFLLEVIQITDAVQPNDADNVAKIVSPPKSVNISLNEKTTLNCTGIGQHINWRVNDTDVKEISDPSFVPTALLISINATANKYRSQLQIKGTPLVNGTRITCIILQLINGIFTTSQSEPVVILVQGSLGAVKKLTINSVDNTAVISWKPPYTFKGVSISHYIVKGFFTSLYAEVKNTTLNHSLNEVMQPRMYYNVSVQAVNLAGEGEVATAARQLTIATNIIHCIQTRGLIPTQIALPIGATAPTVTAVNSMELHQDFTLPLIVIVLFILAILICTIVTIMIALVELLDKKSKIIRQHEEQISKYKEKIKEQQNDYDLLKEEYSVV